MIPKSLCLSNPLRFISPLYSMATTANLSRLATPTFPSVSLEKKAAYHSYCRLATNGKLTTLLNQFQNLAAKAGMQKLQAVHLFLQTLDRMDLETVTSKNLQIIIQIFSGLQGEGSSDKESPIIQRIKERLASLQDSKAENEVTTSLLLKIYTLRQDAEDKQIPANLGEEIITKLKQSTELDLSLQQISSFFVYLSSLFVNSNLDRSIRLLLLRKVKANISTLSLEELSSIGILLNSLSHFDFLDEELGIVEEIFEKMEEKRKQFDEQTIYRIFKADQCLSNQLSLSRFHLRIINTLLLDTKRINSAAAHQLFSLIVLSSQKLKDNSYLEAEFISLQALILKYVLACGKTKKHNKSINSGLQKLIPHCFTKKSAHLFGQVLVQVKFKAKIAVLYELAVMKVNIDPLFEYAQTEDLDLVQTVLMALTLHLSQKASSQLEKCKQKIGSYFTLQKFPTLFNEMRLSSASNLLQNFDKVFGHEIRVLFDNSKIDLNQQHQLLFLKYFIQSLHYSEEKVIELQNYAQSMSNNIVQDLIKDVIKEKSKQNVGKILFLKKISKIWTQAWIQIFQIANKSLRENLFHTQEKNKFWTIAKTAVQNYLDVVNVKDSRQKFSNLLIILFRRYNSKFSDHFYSGSFYSILLVVITCVEKFKEYPELQLSIIKSLLSLNIINRNFEDLGRGLNESVLDQVQKQKLRSVMYSEYTPSIQKIDESSFSIILFNRHCLYLYKERQSEFIQLIRRSNYSALYNYIINIGQKMNHDNLKILCAIVDELSKKINFQQAHMFHILRVFLDKGVVFTYSFHQFMKKYLSFLNSCMRVDDYLLEIMILDVIQSQSLPKDLTHEFIQKLLEKAKEHFFVAKSSIYLNSLYSNFPFQASHVQIIAQLGLPKGLFFLEPLLNKEHKQKIIDKIIQLSQEGKILNRHQYYYLKKKYPRQTQHFNLPESSLLSLKIAQFIDKDKRGLFDIAAATNKDIIQLDFFGNQLFRVKNTLVLFISKFKRNSIYQLSFYKRLLKLQYGNDINVSIILNFPLDYKSVHQKVKFDNPFTDEEWKYYFNKRSNFKRTSSK